MGPRRRGRRLLQIGFALFTLGFISCAGIALATWGKEPGPWLSALLYLLMAGVGGGAIMVLVGLGLAIADFVKRKRQAAHSEDWGNDETGRE